MSVAISAERSFYDTAIRFVGVLADTGVTCANLPSGGDS